MSPVEIRNQLMNEIAVNVPDTDKTIMNRPLVDFAEEFININAENYLKELPLSQNDLFDDEFQGLKVIRAEMLNGHRRQWVVHLENENFVIATDAGNGWFNPITNLNSLELIFIEVASGL